MRGVAALGPGPALHHEEDDTHMLNKDNIVAAIAARAADVEHVDVPEWGGEVGIRRLDAHDMIAAGMMDEEQPKDFHVRVLALSLCDDDGKPLFGQSDIRALDAADAAVTLRLFSECARVNGWASEEMEKVAAAFGGAPRADSSTD